MTQEPIYITWINHLGGFEYFLFKAKNEYQVDIENSGETKENIFPNWPKSYGETADTIQKQTFRDSREAIVVKSQHLSINQVNSLTAIRTSPVVQHVNTRNDRRTILVDTDSFLKYNEVDDLRTMTFRIRFTNQIPSQRL